MSNLSKVIIYLSSTIFKKGKLPASLVLSTILIWPIFPLYFYNIYSCVGCLDPWLYTGYINSYNDLYERYGLTYYSTRIAAIFPSAFLSNQFGDFSYLLVRYLHFLTAQVVFFNIARRFISLRISLLLSMVLIFYPLYVNAYTDDYTVGYATTYSLIALYSLVAIKNIYFKYLMFGFFASLSFNAYEGFALYTLAPMYAAFLITQVKSMRNILKIISTAFFGFLFCQLMLSSVYFYSVKGNGVKFFFQTKSFEMTKWLFEGGAKNWSVPFFSYYLIIVAPVLLILLYLILFRSKEHNNFDFKNTSDEKFILLWSLFSLGLILYGHFVQQSALLGYGFLMNFWIPILSYFVIFLLKKCQEYRIMTYSVLTGFLLIFLIRLFYNFNFEMLLILLSVFAFIIYLSHNTRITTNRNISLWNVLISSLLLIFIVVSPIIGFKSQRFGIDSSSREGIDGKEVYVSAREFQTFVHNNAGNNIIFWYPGNVNYFRSIQSTFLWGYSCLACASGPEFPQINAEMYDVINSKSDLIILSLDRSQLSSAIENLRSYRRDFDSIKTNEISNGDLNFLVSIVKIN
jgi:hypothetical protein